MDEPVVLLPGDQVPASVFPSAPSSSAPLKIGPGLRLLSESDASSSSQPMICATQAGLLVTDPKRNTISLLSFSNRRYIPTTNDLVIAQVHHSSAEYFYCILTPFTPHALLGQLSFEGATKKTRPMFKGGELVYARVLSTGVGAGGEIEITCVNPATGKAEPGGLGQLTGGMVFDVSTGFAARLMTKDAGGVIVLEELGKKLEGQGGFEVAVGRNGKVWVDCPGSGESGIAAIAAIGRCLKQADEKNLDVYAQRKLVAKISQELGL